MASLKFRIEWEDGAGVSHPALAATWARLEISVDNCIITTVREQRSGSPEGLPRIVAAPRSGRQERFLLARRIYFLLSGATSSAPRLVTSGGTRLQASSRAFAAELLAPAKAILARGTGADEERLDQLAEEFDVSPWVISHQLENHRAKA